MLLTLMASTPSRGPSAPSSLALAFTPPQSPQPQSAPQQQTQLYTQPILNNNAPHQCLCISCFCQQCIENSCADCVAVGYQTYCAQLQRQLYNQQSITNNFQRQITDLEGQIAAMGSWESLMAENNALVGKNAQKDDEIYQLQQKLSD